MRTTAMMENEDILLLTTILYYYYSKYLIAPLPYKDRDSDFGFILVIQAFEYFIKQYLPFGYVSLRTKLLENRQIQPLLSQDVFFVLLRRPYELWILTGETPESIQRLVAETSGLPRRTRFRRGNMSAENRIVMTLIWLRHYPTYTLLSLCFGVSCVSVSTVGRILNSTWVDLWEVCQRNITWPTIQLWRQKRGIWPEMPNVVGAIDGTSHEIQIPSTEPQQQFYSGHRKYHCIHTQVIIDNEKNIVHVQSGFLGHDNDGNCYRQIGPIGPNDHLEFPDDCYILGDSIYPNGYPIVTPYKIIDIVRQPPNIKRKRRKFNRLHKSRRVFVEHVIKEIKTFKVIASIYRHPRWMIASIVELCRLDSS